MALIYNTGLDQVHGDKAKAQQAMDAATKIGTVIKHTDGQHYQWNGRGWNQTTLGVMGGSGPVRGGDGWKDASRALSAPAAPTAPTAGESPSYAPAKPAATPASGGAMPPNPLASSASGSKYGLASASGVGGPLTNEEVYWLRANTDYKGGFPTDAQRAAYREDLDWQQRTNDAVKRGNTMAAPGAGTMLASRTAGQGIFPNNPQSAAVYDATMAAKPPMIPAALWESTAREQAAKASAGASGSFGSSRVTPTSQLDTSYIAPVQPTNAPAIKKRGDTYQDGGQTTYYDDLSQTYLSRKQFDAKFNPTPENADNHKRGSFGGSNADGQDRINKTGQADPGVGSAVGDTPVEVWGGATIRPGIMARQDREQLDYITGTRSAYEDVPAMDAAYQARLAGQAVDNAEQQYRLMADRIGANAAQRGLMAGGASGIGESAMRDLAMQTAQARTRGLNDAMLASEEMKQRYGMMRAGGIDSFGLNRGNLAIGMAADTRAQNRQDTLLPLEADAARLANQLDSGLLNPRIDLARANVTGANLGNEAQDLQNVFNARTMDDRVRTIATQYRLNEAQAGQAEFILKHQGALAFLQFIANIAGSAGSLLGRK